VNISILAITALGSVQFIQFHRIHYKSKRPVRYRTSHSAIYIAHFRYLPKRKWKIFGDGLQ